MLSFSGIRVWTAQGRSSIPCVPSPSLWLCGTISRVKECLISSQLLGAFVEDNLRIPA